jgi:hypothetical protein
MKLPRYVDRQFAASFGSTILFYAALMSFLVSTSWWLEEIAAAAFFAFLIWAYRWPIGVKLGWCARRPGALPATAEASGRDPRGA